MRSCAGARALGTIAVAGTAIGVLEIPENAGALVSVELIAAKCETTAASL